MKRLFALALLLFATGAAHAQNTAPPEVTKSAVAAVEKLGKEVLAGHYQASFDRMYPQWKERIAKAKGGVDKLQAEFAQVNKAMAEQGVTILSFQTFGTPTSYEVWPEMKTEKVNGQQVETQVFKKWMVLIPTKMVFNIVRPAGDGQAAQTHTITSQGFQIAVSEKGKNDWTFIDGAGVKVTDLRSVFLSLPEDLQLPEIKRSADTK